MITITFQGLSRFDHIMLGPAPYFRINGRKLHQGPDEAERGTHQNHFWEIEGRFFTAYIVNGEHTIRFSNGAEQPDELFGPYKSIAVADGVLHQDNLHARLLDDAQLWQRHTDDTRWAEVIFEAAPGSP